MPSFQGIHHIGFSVSNLERSTEWYVRVLGFQRGPTIPDEMGRGRKQVLFHPGGAFRLALAQHAANTGDAFSESNSGLDHVAFSVADRAELEQWSRHFTACDVEHSPINEGLTGPLITFRDPDNIQLEVYTVSK